jgi:hyperosmotically inducible periplasmic protein
MTVLKFLVAASLVGGAVFAGPACGVSAAQQATQSVAATLDDSTLGSRINAILEKDEIVGPYDFDVTVKEGVVTLKGTVRTADEKARVERVATITGVTQVRNEVVIDVNLPPASAGSRADRVAAKVKAGTDKAMDATKKATSTAAVKAKEGVGKAVDATGNAATTASEAVTDGWITTKVKAKFADETLLEHSDINVDTNDRVITLKGTVTSNAAKARAAAIARSTKGVKSVVNQLVVKDL